MTPQIPVRIQTGTELPRAIVYLLHVGDARPDARYPKGTFDAIREACGTGPDIVVRADDGTAGPLARASLVPFVREIERDGTPGAFKGLVMGGWSAGVRGIRRQLLASTEHGWTEENLRGIVAADGLHAPWTNAVAHNKHQLGPSEVFRDYIARARTPCDSCKGRGWNVGDCHPREVCGACDGVGAGFAFVLTHSMQNYMEARSANPRYLSTSTVARELTGWPCSTSEQMAGPMGDVWIQNEGRLEVHSYAGPDIDFAGHVRQLREALPRALGRLRGMGVL